MVNYFKVIRFSDIELLNTFLEQNCDRVNNVVFNTVATNQYDCNGNVIVLHYYFVTIRLSKKTKINFREEY